MIEFHLVKANDSDVFEQSINEKIGEGWDLRGPMTSSQGWVYMQPMTRKIKKPKKKEKKDAVA
jgi:hypothetical protein